MIGVFVKGNEKIGKNSSYNVFNSLCIIIVFY